MKSLTSWLILALLFFPGFAMADGSAPWSTSGTAQTLEEGRWEIGIFQPLRWGVTDRIEISTYPLTSALSPNVELKRSYEKRGSAQLASFVGITYPTQLLRLLSREGAGGIYPPDATIPHMIGFEAGLYASFDLPSSMLLTLRGGARTAARFGEIDMPTVDLPIAYTRLAHYHDLLSLHLRVLLDGPIWGPLFFSVDVEAWGLPLREEGMYALEHLGLVTWRVSEGFAVQAGYKFVYGEYPFGGDWHLFPLADLLWAW